MKDDGVFARADIVGKVANMRSGRCINGSYYRKFKLEYSGEYRDKSGELIHVNMRQYIVGFNDVARKIKAEIENEDQVYVIGRLKSRPLENYEDEVFIEVEEPGDITIIPDRAGLQAHIKDFINNT